MQFDKHKVKLDHKEVEVSNLTPSQKREVIRLQLAKTVARGIFIAGCVAVGFLLSGSIFGRRS